MMAYRIIDGAEDMDISQVIALLQYTYWGKDRPREKTETAIANSRCIGVYGEEEGRQAGFCRIFSDMATTYYLCDVIVEPECRGKGVGRMMLEYVTALPEYRGFRGVLFTRTAGGFYEKFGFRFADGRAMVKDGLY